MKTTQVPYITMKSILICLFVFTLGSLAVKIPKPNIDENKVPDVPNEDSLGERSGSDLSSASHDASLITKRAVGKHNTGRWRKANSSPVCFSARNHNYGRFYVPSRGRLAAVKLVHLYGYVSCNTRHASAWSYWGCGGSDVNIAITTKYNHVLLPSGQFIYHSAKWSRIPGYNSNSPELVLSSFSAHPHSVYKGQQLRLFYGEDLVNGTEGDNGGRVCCDVYTLLV